MLVKFSCGCIGFLGLSDKAEKGQKLMDEVGALVFDGQRYREIRSLLRL